MSQQSINSIIQKLKANEAEGLSDVDPQGLDLLVELRHAVERVMVGGDASNQSSSAVIVREEHPDGHNANATMSCLDGGLSASLAIDLSADYFKGMKKDQVADELRVLLEPLSQSPAVGGITLEIGAEGSEQ